MSSTWEKAVFVALYCLALLSPLPFLAFLWRKVLSHDKSNFIVAVAGLASISYCYLLAGLMYKPTLLGPDYSDRLFITLEANTAFTLGLFVLALFRRSPVRNLLTCSVFSLTLAWFLVLAINTTV
jgi:hypothetical protein